MHSGFSLLELSIVLVIIGLLAGGVMTGQSLIRAAEQRSIITQFSQYTTALHGFRDKYRALPGDMKNATSFWGDQATGTSACADAAIANGTPGTCNGDSNATIGWSGGINNENYRAWQQLAMAGLVEGSYAGTIAVSSTAAVPGVDIPASKVPNAGWTLINLNQNSSVNTELGFSDLPNQYNHYLYLGTTTTIWGGNPILTPSDAWGADSKLDDGKPGYGRVRGSPFGAAGPAGCVSTGVAATSVYNVNLSSALCALGFILS